MLLLAGSCQVTAIAINEDNHEFYVGTNSGCIIVAESNCLKPITVFRPYAHEVKFILTFPEYKLFLNYQTATTTTNEETIIDEGKFAKIEEEEKKNANKTDNKNAFRNSLHQVSSNFWPFSKRNPNKATIKEINKNSNKQQQNSRITTKSSSSICESRTNKSLLSRRRPFVAIGRGYRNLLDRFIYTSSSSSTTNKTNASLRSDSQLIVMEGENNMHRLKDSNSLHAIIWNAGNWNVE